VRYYDIIISEADGRQFARYTSFVNGKTDLGALQIEIDIPIWNLANPAGAGSVKIWGVSLQTIGQASDFNGKKIKVYAGMQAGLPLANPAQAGLIITGEIAQGFGNWIGNNQWIELIITADQNQTDQGLNIVLDWKKGSSLADAIRQTLSVAIPNYKVDISISNNLVLGGDEHGFYHSLVQFAQYIKVISRSILGGGEYNGVDILISDGSFKVFDGTSPTSPLQLNFKDLVGQPTWQDPGTIMVTVVMRADLGCGKYVRLPETQVTIAPASPFVTPKDKSAFQGAFVIREMRHIGNFRQSDALAWITLLTCSPSSSGPV
jgi:hypothetical protein